MAGEQARALPALAAHSLAGSTASPCWGHALTGGTCARMRRTFDPSNGADGCDGGGCCFLKESGTYEFGANSELTSGVHTG